MIPSKQLKEILCTHNLFPLLEYISPSTVSIIELALREQR